MFNTLLKLIVPVIALGSASVVPALAGPKENAVLASYAGSWTGKGNVTGMQTGKVSCRLTFKPVSSGALSYSGRCSFGAMAQQTFRGTVSYNDAKNRYEASSSAQGIQTTAIGKKSGGGMTFTSEGMDTRYGSASSTMAFAGAAIKLNFKLIDKKGEVTASAITFSKS